MYLKGSPAIREYREEILSHVRASAAKLSGPQVLAALESASDDVWDSGLDVAYDRMVVTQENAPSPEERSGLFDITWISIFAVHLAKLANQPQTKGTFYV